MLLEPGHQATIENGTKIFREPISEVPKPSYQGPLATDLFAPSQGRTPNRRHVSGKKSQERQRKAGARRWLEPGHPIRWDTPSWTEPDVSCKKTKAQVFRENGHEGSARPRMCHQSSSTDQSARS